MSAELIVRHCAPTLAGLKLGNLFSYRFDNLQQLNETLLFFNNLLNEKGVYFALLRSEDGFALIYVYRRRRVEAMLEQEEIRIFLSLWGYENFSVDECLSLLGEHLKKKDFPHEIGVFLSYPLSDILAFIENKGRNYKEVGCWKVYSDVEKARETFARYKKCTKVYRQKLSQAFDITRLTVVG